MRSKKSEAVRIWVRPASEDRQMVFAPVNVASLPARRSVVNE